MPPPPPPQKKNFISHLEYMHRNKIIDLCFDEKYLIKPYDIFT
jgi:hypothetical protein